MISKALICPSIWDDVTLFFRVKLVLDLRVMEPHLVTLLLELDYGGAQEHNKNTRQKGKHLFWLTLFLRILSPALRWFGNEVPTTQTNFWMSKTWREHARAAVTWTNFEKERKRKNHINMDWFIFIFFLVYLSLKKSYWCWDGFFFFTSLTSLIKFTALFGTW